MERVAEYRSGLTALFSRADTVRLQPGPSTRASHEHVYSQELSRSTPNKPRVEEQQTPSD